MSDLAGSLNAVVVALALASAMCFASASVLQQRAAVTVPTSRSMRLGLITSLIRRPMWLAGLVADAAGFALQIAALERGALTLVQPILGLGLLFALIFNSSPGKTGLRKRDWAAAGATAFGLIVFVVAGAPKGSASAELAGWVWVVFCATTGAVVLACAKSATGRSAAHRAALLALGAGIAMALSAALTKQTLSEFHDGFWHMLTTGYPYALLAAGAAGMLLSQSAFQAGALVASLPTLTLAEPIYASFAGAVLFGEHLRGGWLAVLAIAGALVSGVAVVFLARSPRAQPVRVA